MISVDNLTKEVRGSKSDVILKSIVDHMHGHTMHHHYHILYDIRTLLGEEKKTYLEIGTFNGGSASLMMSHPFVTDIICIDPFYLPQTNETYLINNIKRFNIYERDVKIFKSTSQQSPLIDQLKHHNTSIDILYIDGDHSYYSVKDDFNMYVDFVNPNGLIVFDDYYDYKFSPEVKYAVDDIVKILDPSKYNIIGTLDNIKKPFCYFQPSKSMEYIIQKIA